MTDTIYIIRDTIVANITMAGDGVQPLIREAETNWLDVAIVGIICVAICVLAYIIVDGLRDWQKDNLAKQGEYDEKKREHELKVKEKEAALKETAEENTHRRKALSLILDHILKSDKQNEQKVSGCGQRFSEFAKRARTMMDDILKKAEPFFKECNNEENKKAEGGS